MKKHRNNLDKAIDTLKNEPVPINPPQETTDATLAKLAEATDQFGPAKKRIKIVERIRAAKSFTKIAAAAVIITAVLIGIEVFTGPPEKPGEKIVKPVGIPETEDVTKTVKGSVPDSDVKLQAELKKIQEMVTAGDIEGLVSMLEHGQFESRLLSAIYLAKMGDLQAVEILEKLIAEQDAEGKNNLLATVASQIRSRLDKEAELTKAVETQREAPAAKAKETITYRGIVTNESGQPIEGVTVKSNLVRYAWLTEFKGWEKQAYTDSEGKFEIGPVPLLDNKKARRTLIFKHPDYAIGWFQSYWGRKGKRDANSLEVALLKPAILTGTVTDQAGNPIESAVIQASLQLRLPRTFRYLDMTKMNDMAVSTDAEGYFLIDKIPEGARLHIDVLKKGYTRYLSREKYRGDMYPIRTGEDLKIVLEQGGFINGQLVLNGSNYKKKGIIVVALGPGGGWAGTDEKGRFEIIGLAPGTYTVSVNNDSMAELGLVCKAISSYDVKIGTAGPDVRLELQKGLPVTVKVTDKNTGEPVEKARVRAALRDNEDITIASGNTDTDGKCAISLTAGEYTLFAQGWENGQFRQFSKDFVVDPNGQDLSIQIAITPRPFIYGWLLDANEQPIRGTVMWGYGEAVETDEAGEFAMLEPWGEPGEIHIGYAFDNDKKLGRAFFWKKSDEPNELEIILEPLATIVGRIVDQDGNSVTDVRLKLDIIMGGGLSRGTSGNLWKTTIESDGRFKFEGVPVGLPMRVSADKPRYQGWVELPQLKPGEVLDAGDVVLKPMYGFEDGQADWSGTLPGRVINENNEPMPGLRVQSQTGGKMFEDITDTKGRFTLKGLPKDKKISGSVYADGYGHTMFKTVVDGNSLDIKIFPQGWDLLNKPAPGLFVEKWLNTEPVTLAQYHGKVVLFQIGVLLPNYSWQFNRVQQVLEKYHDKGLEVIAVHERSSVTWTGEVTEEDILAFIKKHDIKFPFGIDGDKMQVADMVPAEELVGNGAMYSLYDVKATPALYLIDKQGILQISPIRDNLDEWIERLLAE